MNYRIVEYYAENFQRLRLVEFQPKGRMTIFTGKNDQGKTSALDAVPFVLGGRKYSPELPTRKGSNKLKVKLNLGEFTVERTNSGMRLTMAPGCTAWGTPQAMLDSIFDELAFDPLDFIRKDPREQVKFLLLSLGLTEKIQEIDRKNTEDFEVRREINREIKTLESEISTYTLQQNLPAEKIDEEEIRIRISEVGKRNQQVAQIIQRKIELSGLLKDREDEEKRNLEFLAKCESDRKVLDAELAEASSDIQRLESVDDRIGAIFDIGIPEKFNTLIRGINTFASELGETLRFLQSKIDNGESKLSQLVNSVQAANDQMERISASVAEARQAWQDAPEGQIETVDDLMKELATAQLTNREIDKRTKIQALRKDLDAKQNEARKLTRNIDNREEEKRALVASAKLPVTGLSFTNDQVLFDGVPLRQLGEAKQIKISVALVMARNPKLRWVRISHGEALDDESMAELKKMAEELDCYIWMAKVDTTGQVGIYLEDGEIKAING